MPREYPDLLRELKPDFVRIGFFMDGTYYLEFFAWAGL